MAIFSKVLMTLDVSREPQNKLNYVIHKSKFTVAFTKVVALNNLQKFYFKLKK
tara:strand:- start:6249 stop:6407 length:159 start_codon:yes stop_codon:yes gene_type:complete